MTAQKILGNTAVKIVFGEGMNSASVAMTRKKSKFIDVTECASILGVAERTIYQWSHRRKIPCYKFSGVLRFNEEEILEWCNAQKKEASKPQVRSLSKFESVRERIRSLKTEDTTSFPALQKGVG